MKTPNDTHEPDEIELLLPWYANGTLDPDERRKVERALAGDPRLAASLALILEDRDQTLSLAEATEAPASMDARFLGQLGAEMDRARMPAKPALGAFDRAGGWLERLFGALTPARLGFAAIAAAVIIALQAGIILSLVGPAERGDPNFEIATGDDPASAGTAMLVQFADGAAMAEIADFLAVNGGRIADGPLPGGLFRLRFAEREGREAAGIAAMLSARQDLFAVVLP